MLFFFACLKGGSALENFSCELLYSWAMQTVVSGCETRTLLGATKKKPCEAYFKFCKLKCSYNKRSICFLSLVCAHFLLYDFTCAHLKI
jgi:hypothetical protein